MPCIVYSPCSVSCVGENKSQGFYEILILDPKDKTERCQPQGFIPKIWALNLIKTWGKFFFIKLLYAEKRSLKQHL